MSNNIEIDIFLRRLGYIYNNNSNFEILKDTLYDELRNFKSALPIYEKVDIVDISHVQTSLNAKYSKRTQTISNGYFWAINNRGKFNDNEQFRDAIDNSIKMYIAVDENSIEFVADQVFDFMLRNNIVTQSKISKVTRNDALVLRVATIDDVKKITEFINGLNYDSKNKPNPFLYSSGKVSIAMDGSVSFNYTLCSIMETYFSSRKKDDMLASVCFDDFLNFLTFEYKEILGLSDTQVNEIISNIRNGHKGTNADYSIMAYKILCDNLNGNINSLDYFKSLQNVDLLNNYNKVHNKPLEGKVDYQTYGNYNNNLGLENAYIEIMYKLMNLNSKDVNHQIYINYINSGNKNFFTRTNSIRDLVSNNFTPITFYETMNNIGWKSLLNAFKETYDKYGYEQVVSAINKLMFQGDYKSFTNNNNVRTILINSIPLDYLKNVVYKKVCENNMEYTIDNIVECLFNEMNLNYTNSYNFNK